MAAELDQVLRRGHANARGRPIEAVLERAPEQLSVLLPDALETEGTWLLMVLDESGHEVGIGLNVFGINEAARRRYALLGYRVVATQMTKTLETRDA